MRILVLPGDGIGPEIAAATLTVLERWPAGREGQGQLAGAGGAVRAVDRAVDRVLAAPDRRTADLGGPLGTRAFCQAVAAALG